MADPLLNIKISLRNQISRELYDYADTYHGWTALLLALDNMYGTSTRFTKSEDVAGSEMQVEFRASLPTVQGVNAVTGALASLELPTQQNYSIIGGKMPWSHYQFREDVRQAYIDHMSKDPKSAVPYVKQVAQGVRDAIISKLEDDMIPTTAVSASVGNAAENKVLAVPYALQNPGSAYEYLDLDLNSAPYSGLRATVKTSFGTLTLQNLRNYLLLPLHFKMAKIDVGLCDSSVFDYIIDAAEDKIVLSQADKLDYGGQMIRYGGIIWIPISNMDSLSASREIYVLDSSSWEFRQKGLSSNFGLTDHPDTATLVTMKGMFIASLICKIPRKNGRGTGVTLS